MGRILENGAPYESVTSLFERECLLPEFVRELGEEVGQKGRVILSISVNGTAYAIDQLSDTLCIGKDDTVEFTSDTPIHVVQKSLDDVLGQIASYSADMDRIIDLLIQGDKDQAFTVFTTFLGEFHDIIRMMQTIEATFGLNFDGITYGSERKSLQSLTELLVKTLTEVRQAMEGGDMVALTDQLEYELKPQFEEELKGALQALRDTLTPIAE